MRHELGSERWEARDRAFGRLFLFVQVLLGCCALLPSVLELFRYSGSKGAVAAAIGIIAFWLIGLLGSHLTAASSRLGYGLLLVPAVALVAFLLLQSIASLTPPSPEAILPLLVYGVGFIYGGCRLLQEGTRGKRLSFIAVSVVTMLLATWVVFLRPSGVYADGRSMNISERGLAVADIYKMLAGPTELQSMNVGARSNYGKAVAAHVRQLQEAWKGNRPHGLEVVDTVTANQDLATSEGVERALRRVRESRERDLKLYGTLSSLKPMPRLSRSPQQSFVKKVELPYAAEVRAVQNFYKAVEDLLLHIQQSRPGYDPTSDSLIFKTRAQTAEHNKMLDSLAKASRDYDDLVMDPYGRLVRHLRQSVELLNEGMPGVDTSPPSDLSGRGERER